MPPGENGEVIVAGDVVMAGYWNNPSATAQALRNGWLWTGDVGTFDVHGFLYLKDRSKDVSSPAAPTSIHARSRRCCCASCRDRVSVNGRQHPDGARRLLPS